MRFIALLASVVILTVTVLLALKSTDPKLYLKLALTFDVIGISDNTQEEKSRLEKIDLLPIADEKKAILINKTIFLGASPSMVKLALGSPENKVRGDASDREQWIYHFEEDTLPTTLDFKNNKLISAQSSGR